MAPIKEKRYSDEVLKQVVEDLTKYLDLKFDTIEKSLHDANCHIKRHDVLLVGERGDAGLVKENNDLKNSLNMLKLLGIVSASLASFFLTIKTLINTKG